MVRAEAARDRWRRGAEPVTARGRSTRYGFVISWASGHHLGASVWSDMHHANKQNSAPPADTASGGRRPRPNRGRMYAFGALAAAGLLAASYISVHGAGSAGSAAAASTRPAASRTAVPADTPTHAASHQPAADGKGDTHSKASPGADYERAGNGVFTTASASGKSDGTGTPRRYKVQVEQGTGVSATDAAQEIEGILADPRGWTADGKDAFQLVSGGSYDFEVKIATPTTVDKICGAAGLHTHGEVNCDVGAQVVVNLKRWQTGSPEFPGPLHDYRALIINHEVGHRIGHGHEGCPGPGRPAPAMMQQIDGLHGCVANAWPYDSHGTYLGGPSVP
jgi:Protein of unknown function (DUF3152)